MKRPIYESWGTAGGREGVQRTLTDENAQDRAFLDEGIRIVDDTGKARKLTPDEANAMGVRRVVAAKDIHTGEMKWREDKPEKTAFFVVRA